MEKVMFVKLFHPWQYDPYSDPPLGLLSVASTARRMPNLEVSLLDQAHEKIPIHADYFGISATTLEFPEAVNQAQRIKSAFPKSKVIAGGPHFDALPESLWRDEIERLPFDVICRGEGEATIKEAVDYLKERRDKKRVISQQGPLLDLDSLEFPARELLDRNLYFVPGKAFSGGIQQTGSSTTIMVSRGCPFSCSFCASPALHNRKLRFRSLDKIIGELEHLKREYGVSSLRWQDDCIHLNFRRHPPLAEYLHNSCILSRGSARTDQISPQVLDILWYSGFRELGFGIESSEQAVLDMLHKGTTAEQNRSALKMAKQRGFRTRAFMMTGLPGETKDSGKNTIDFLEDARPDVVTLTSFIPLPGCDIYRNPGRYGIKIRTQDWSRYDIALKWEAGAEWTHEIWGLTLQDMENNREMLKRYIFNRKISNVPVYNRDYG